LEGARKRAASCKAAYLWRLNSLLYPELLMTAEMRLHVQILPNQPL
jgi:hypothetical protein